MLERFSRWYFGPDMEEKDKRPYLHFIMVTHLASLLAMFGPIRGLGPCMWAAAMLLDFFMHARKIDGRYPLSMPGALCVAGLSGSILLLFAWMGTSW